MLLCPWDFPGKNTRVGCHFLPQGSSWLRDWTHFSCTGRRILYGISLNHQFSSVQLLSRVRLFATPWTIARQTSLSITNSWSSPKPVSIESVMPSSISSSVVPFSSCPQSFPASESFQMSQLFVSGSQSIGVSISTTMSRIFFQREKIKIFSHPWPRNRPMKTYQTKTKTQI